MTGYEFQANQKKKKGWNFGLKTPTGDEVLKIRGVTTIITY
jgi:hypothetical protein